MKNVRVIYKVEHSPACRTGKIGFTPFCAQGCMVVPTKFVRRKNPTKK